MNWLSVIYLRWSTGKTNWSSYIFGNLSYCSSVRVLLKNTRETETILENSTTNRQMEQEYLWIGLIRQVVYSRTRLTSFSFGNPTIATNRALSSLINHSKVRAFVHYRRTSEIQLIRQIDHFRTRQSSEFRLLPLIRGKSSDVEQSNLRKSD